MKLVHKRDGTEIDIPEEHFTDSHRAAGWEPKVEDEGDPAEETPVEETEEVTEETPRKKGKKGKPVEPAEVTE